MKQSADKLPRGQRKDTLKLKMNEFQEKKLEEVRLPGGIIYLYFLKIPAAPVNLKLFFFPF